MEIFKMQQHHNPSIPLLTPLKSQLVPGSKIGITGWPIRGFKSITVNLKCSAGSGGEVAFHFNIRSPPFEYDPVVVRNTRTSAGWGQEERDASHYPFSVEEIYKIEILCEKVHYRVLVNERLFTVYTHRLPLQFVSHLEIRGDTDVSLVEVKIPGKQGNSYLSAPSIRRIITRAKKIHNDHIWPLTIILLTIMGLRLMLMLMGNFDERGNWKNKM